MKSKIQKYLDKKPDRPTYQVNIKEEAVDIIKKGSKELGSTRGEFVEGAVKFFYEQILIDKKNK